MGNDAALVKQVHLQDGNSIMVATTPTPLAYVVASSKKGEDADLMPSVLLASRVCPTLSLSMISAVSLHDQILHSLSEALHKNSLLFCKGGS